MPNWVYNNVSINVKDKDEAEKLQNFLEDKESVFSFNKVIERPKEQEDNWYDWNISNWGTKWDANDAHLNIGEDGKLNYSFSSAWSPPMSVVQKLSEKFPTVPINFHFREEQGWGAETNLLNGEISVVKEWDIPQSHADMDGIENGTCYCMDNDEQYFDDCYTIRANALPDITPKMLEVIKGLAKDWHSSFEELVAAAKII